VGVREICVEEIVEDNLNLYWQLFSQLRTIILKLEHPTKRSIMQDVNKAVLFTSIHTNKDMHTFIAQLREGPKKKSLQQAVSRST
jgi:hypothetical protein